MLLRSDNGWQLAPKPSDDELRRLRGGFDVHGKKLAAAAGPGGVKEGSK